MTSSDPLSNISSRVQSLEGRFDENINKINIRLDQIVDLMQKVTSLQEREIKNADHINELKSDIKEINTSVKDWNARIHERMDKHIEDINVCRNGLVSTITTLEDELYTKIASSETQNLTTRQEFEKWFNRGAGAWAVGAVLVAVLQGVGAYFINDNFKTLDKIQLALDKNAQRITYNERDYHDLWRYVNTVHPSLGVPNIDKQRIDVEK